MMNRPVLEVFVTLFVACLLSLTKANTKYADCGSVSGKIQSLVVSGCDSEDRCILKSGSTVSLSASFKSLVDSNKATTVIHGIIGGVPLPFPVPDPNACQSSGIQCPVENGKSYDFSYSLQVKTTYPKLEVDVKWELQDDNGKDIICAIIPAKIV
ncbi:NPC intracellular cholesterol transporter 2 homolog a-like [Tachypleus tridentatus]|uniref:NPC intracellular cholesterol transporter 2 homolog a-like n=1 Tax=Tachypleus tridentatus TaxID=6853 RepID=UPI003FCF58AA